MTSVHERVQQGIGRRILCRSASHFRLGGRTDIYMWFVKRLVLPSW